MKKVIWLEDDKSEVEYLKHVSDGEYDITFVSKSLDFINADLKNYDGFVVDYNINGIRSNNLIHNIKSSTVKDKHLVVVTGVVPPMHLINDLEAYGVVFITKGKNCVHVAMEHLFGGNSE